jgi:hypothetical protein
VATIARDAEGTVGAALESVRSIADEIVVVDTGSKDRTRELARKGASKVVDFRWADDFAAARNFALAQLTGDWVLWIDASEQLDAESAKQIRERLDSQVGAPLAYLPMVQLPAGPGQIEGEQIGRVRLWPTKAGLKFAGRVREQLAPAPEAVGLQQETTTWRIRRSARDIDPQVKAAKANRDLRLCQLEIDEHGERPHLLLALGEAWAALGDPLKSAGWFRRAVDDSPQASTEQLEAFYGLLTTFDSRPQARDQQIATCLEALAAFPLDAQLLCAMGSYLQAQGRLELASRSYQMAVEHGAIDLRTWHLANLADLATICLSLTLELQDRGEEARRYVEAGLAARANSDRLRRRLIELHIKHNRRQEALAQIEHLPNAISQRDALRNAIRGACMGGQQQWPAALAYLRTAYEAGCRDPICLRWLSLGLLSTDETKAAEAAIREWQLVSPDNPEPARLLAATADKKMSEQSDSPLPIGQPAPNPFRFDMPAPAGIALPAIPHLGTPLSSPQGGMFAR